MEGRSDEDVQETSLERCWDMGPYEDGEDCRMYGQIESAVMIEGVGIESQ